MTDIGFVRLPYCTYEDEVIFVYMIRKLVLWACLLCIEIRKMLDDEVA